MTKPKKGIVLMNLYEALEALADAHGMNSPYGKILTQWSLGVAIDRDVSPLLAKGALISQLQEEHND